MTMRMLDRKLLRDIRRMWSQALAIAAVLACGVMIMVMAAGTERSLTETRQTFYERNRFGDVFSLAARAPNTLAADIAAIEGVARVETRISQHAILDIEGMVEPAVGQLLSVAPAGNNVLNVPLIRTGRFPDVGREQEVMVNENFAKAHGFEIGDRFHITLNGQRRELRIVGTALSPEFIYTISPGALMPDDRRYGILWMAEDVLAAAFDLTGAFNEVSVTLTHGTDEEAVKDRLEDILKPYGGAGAFGRDQQISNAFLDGELEQLAVMKNVIPPIFLAVSAFLVNMVFGRLITLEREQIGLLKALGYRDREIAWHYMKLAALIGAVGIVLGWGAGMLLATGMAQLYAQFFSFPYLVIVQYPAPYAVSALAGLAAVMAGAIGAVRKVVALNPAIAMSPPAPTRFRRGLFDRIIHIFRPSQPTMMIIRAIGRWPVRAGMTTLGIATSCAVLVASTFMFDAMDELLDVAFVEANRQDAILVFAAPRAEGALNDVENLPGVMAAEGAASVAARLYNGHLSRMISIEGRRPDDQLSRVYDTSSGDLVHPEHGIVLARRLAAHLGAQVGDVIEVEFLQYSEHRHRLVVTGLAGQYFGLGAYMEMDTLSAILDQSPQISMANILIDDDMEDALYTAVKSAPIVSGITFLSGIRQSFEDTIAENAGMTTVINSFIAALIAIGVVYNSARIQLSERARELASLRILGFTRGEVSYILLGELFLLTLVALPLGAFMGFGFAAGMVTGFESDLYAIPLVIKPATYANAALVVMVASVGSALIVRRKIDRMDLVAVLKTRE